MERLRLVHLCAAVMLIACTILLVSVGSDAQDKRAGDIILPQIGSGSVDAYIEALKSDIRAHTRRIMELNMQLTEKEAGLFWPIYGRYDQDMSRLDYEKAQQYEFYAANYKTLTDEQARHMLKMLDSIDRRKLVMGERYEKEMTRVLPPRTVLRFVQIAKQVDRLVSLKIMSGMPIVPKDAR